MRWFEVERADDMQYNDYELLDLILDNDEDSYNILLDKYKPLICKMAKKYYNCAINNYYVELTLNDFINEGYLAFDKAIRNFNQDKECLFFSYLYSCLKSSYGLILRNLFALKNKPLLHYQELDFEINDSKQVDPYNHIDNIVFNDELKDYLLNLDFIDSAILELRFNNFKYREIVDLLDVNNTRINRVVRKAKKFINTIDNYFIN